MVKKKPQTIRTDYTVPFRRSIRSRLIVWFLVLSLIPLTVTGTLVYLEARNILKQQAFDKLVAIRGIKASQVNAFFEERQRDLSILVKDGATLSAMQGLAEAFDTLGAEQVREFFLGNPELDRVEGAGSYSVIHGVYHPKLKHLAQIQEFVDIFLIEPETGFIIYSMAKEDEFGTSLLSGPFAETKLADAFRKARQNSDPEAVFLTDFERHDHTLAKTTDYICYMVTSISKGDRLVGVVGVEMRIAPLNAIMTERAGMGKSGEAYLVGADKLMRSDSRFSEESTIFQREVDTTATTLALAGQAGTAPTTDYRGEAVLSAYQPLNLPGFQWALLVDVDQAEAFASVGGLLATFLGAGIITLVAVVAVALVLAMRLSQPIVAVTRAAAKISDGNLNQKVETSARDETGLLALVFNRMRSRLRFLLEQITSTALRLSASSKEMSQAMEQVNTATEQVATTVNEMAQGAATQAKRAEEISYAVTQLAAATAQIAGNAYQTEDASSRSQELMQTSVHAMHRLGDRLSQIRQMVTLVDEIADQSNLLSLNASIEAARAGEHGRGFAVVANEVRRLAEHSAESVARIAELSQDIETGLQEMQTAAQETQHSVERTVMLAHETRSATRAQEDAAQAMVNAVNEMAAIAEQDAAASEEIAVSVEEQATSMENVAQSAQILTEMAHQLQQTALDFSGGTTTLCPNFAICPIFEPFTENAALDGYMHRYCKADFKACARKRVKDTGQPVPIDLMPDGTRTTEG